MVNILNKKRKVSEKKLNCTEEEHVKVNSDGGTLNLRINCEGCSRKLSVNDADCREHIIDNLLGNPVDKIILDTGFYTKEYNIRETRMLRDVAKAADSVRLWGGDISEGCGNCGKEKEKVRNELKRFIKRDPIGAYLRAEETIRKEAQKQPDKFPRCAKCHSYFIENMQEVKDILGGTNLIEEAIEKDLLEFLEVDFRTKQGEIIDIERKAYEALFSPLVVPFFSASRLISRPPAEAEFLSGYYVKGAKVELFSLPGTGEELYFIIPPEYGIRYKLEILKVLKRAYENLLEIAPKVIESRDEEHAAEHFKIMCRNEIMGAASDKKVMLSTSEINEMVDMLVRCMMGLDVIEIMLQDPDLQDVYINSPVETTPVYVKHSRYDDCKTNVYLTNAAANNIISKFRLKSGRSFSEVSPILDMELPDFGVRVNITGPPISPDGYAFAFRRGSESPWTLLKFIENKMISPYAAGLLGFMVNEESTILMCGDRGSGKTSILTGLISAMPVKNRILTVEDTFEIPANMLAKEGGFRIQRMKVRPPTSGEDTFELSTKDAMRSILRMGDSAIIMGEVRGTEARVLYEAMNVGGSGNCVLGTIHGKSARNLFERVVHSLEVDEQSFKATDIVVLASRIRPLGGKEKFRRIVEIDEVSKRWMKADPEKIFKPLMKYNPEKDELEICDALKNPRKSEVIAAVAERWGSTPKNVLREIECRGRIYKEVVDRYNELKEEEVKGVEVLLGVKTMTEINNRFMIVKDELMKKYVVLDYDKVYDGWNRWFGGYVGRILGRADETTGKGLNEIKEEYPDTRMPLQPGSMDQKADTSDDYIEIEIIDPKE